MARRSPEPAKRWPRNHALSWRSKGWAVSAPRISITASSRAAGVMAALIARLGRHAIKTKSARRESHRRQSQRLGIGAGTASDYVIHMAGRQYLFGLCRRAILETGGVGDGRRHLIGGANHVEAA